jgi:drug/metabolite transporter (DMT)-like permease
VVNGVITGLGILTLNLAIDLGSVTLAAPLASTVPLWALFFGRYLFKGEEIGPRQVALAVLVVIGVALIVTR